jgi:hypothetical protein
MFKVQQFISFIFSGMNHETGPTKLNILEILTILLYIVVLTKTAKVQKIASSKETIYSCSLILSYFPVITICSYLRTQLTFFSRVVQWACLKK